MLKSYFALQTPFKTKVWLTTLILGLGFLAEPALGDTIPTIVVSTQTVKVLRLQKISVARHATVSIQQNTVDSWMTAGSQALQIKDSQTDAACPVELQREGSFATFTDTAPFDFSDIDSIAAYEALRTFIPQRVKIVNRIRRCGEETTNDTFNGCSDQPIGNYIASHIVLASEGNLTPVTLTHEFGHNQGLPDLDDFSLSKRIMYGTGVEGRNEVTEDECSHFKR